MIWRLGLDLGTNSIGWAILELALDDAGAAEPCTLRDMGVRIFPDGREPAGKDAKTGLPKIGESLAVARRMARGMRRNRDRRLRRLRCFADTMLEFGLFDAVADKDGRKIGVLDSGCDPYHARAVAASQPVEKHVLARALLHLNKRRGFLSNRRADGEDRDATERKEAMQTLERILAERGMTLGQYLHERREQGHHVRFRGAEFADADRTMPIYPTRRMYTHEFHAIRKAQGNLLLTDEQWDALYAILSFQRPLLPQNVGVCSFEHGEDGRERHARASRHLPIAHDFRILQDVNNLRYQKADGEFALTAEQRTQLVALLQLQKNMTWSKIRSKLKLKDVVFNLESEQRKYLLGNETACLMRDLFARYEMDWDNLDEMCQNDIVQAMLDGTSLEKFIADHGYAWPQELIADLSAKTFSSAHGHLSRRCMEKLLPLMRSGKMYWEAASEVYGDHTDYSFFATGEVLEELPYYGEVLRGATMPVTRKGTVVAEIEARFGRIPNPTVHVVLNQLRKLMNALIRKYGSPYEIHLELARELKTAGRAYQDLLKGLAENTVANERRRKLYAECFDSRQPTATDLLKMRLWEELGRSEVDGGANSMGRVDVYTGRVIGFRQLFSDEIEIEHLLPFGRTYDDSAANKTVTFRDVNRRKGGNLLPYDFACADNAIDPEAMVRRAQGLPKGKRWRFLPDAAAIYERMITRTMSAEERRAFDADKGGAFIDRQLVDTRYASRLAARYLVPVVGDPARVIPVNGHVTNMLRHRWGINLYKDKGGDSERKDNRHHAEDALLVALTSRSLIKRIADETRRKQEGRGEFKARLCFPERPAWVTDEQIRAVADRINVSYRPDHSREARFYGETAYGFVHKDDVWSKDGFNVVVRRAVTALKETEIAQIRDRAVRAAIVDFLERPEIRALKKWEDRLARLAQTQLCISGTSQPTVVRHVRIVLKNQGVEPVPSASYKGYQIDSIAFCDIWAIPKKSAKSGKKFDYKGSYVDYIQAKKFEGNEDALHLATRPHPAARKVMRLRKNDMVLVRDDAGNEVSMRVVRLLRDNRIMLRHHAESKEGNDLRKSLSVFIGQYLMRKIRIDIDGYMRFLAK